MYIAISSEKKLSLNLVD